MIFVLLSDVLTGGLRVTVCLFLMSRLLSAEKPDRKSVFTGLAGVSAITVLQCLTDLPELYRIALEVVWIMVCARRLQRADFRMGLFVTIYYEIAVSLWQFLLMAGMGILFRAPALPEDGSWDGLAIGWLLHILLAVLTVFFWKKETESEKIFLRFASAAALTGFIAVTALSEQTMLVLPEDTLIMWTIQAIILMTSIRVFHMRRLYEAEQEQARLKSEQAGLLERDYTTLSNTYAVHARLFHDLHNHIGALRQLLLHERYAEAVQYLDELQAPVREMTDTVWTGDETVDYLINSKGAAAANWGIQLRAQVEFPRHTDIQSADLCAILGNLLDNALEAARQVAAPEQRFVRLTIRRVNQMLVIKVENSFAASPVQEKGELKSTKAEGGLHGWGLKSAQTAAEKYDGMVRTTYTGDLFQAVVTLSYQGVTIE